MPLCFSLGKQLCIRGYLRNFSFFNDDAVFHIDFSLQKYFRFKYQSYHTDQQAEKDIHRLHHQEAFARIGQQRQRAVTVLHDGAGEQDAERDGAAGEQVNPHELRLRLGDDADAERHKQQHPRQPLVLPDERVQVEEVVEHRKGHQHAQRPEQHRQEMVFDDMLPQMFLQEMLGAESHHHKRQQCQDAEHDVLAMQVVMLLGIVMMVVHIPLKFMAFRMMMVLMVMMELGHRLVTMVCIVMSRYLR